MVSTSQEYKNALYRINSNNPPSIANLVPKSEPIYEINLNTREINSPEYLSVSKDHKAETIHFRVARYFDNVDLATTSCIIQYKNAKGETHLYIVPFYDVTTLNYGKEPNEFSEMIIPWMLEGPATAAAGVVEYSFKFFKMDKAYIPVEVTKETFKPNVYYVHSDGKYALAEEFTEGKVYYEFKAEIVYSLNTVPAKSKVLQGMKFEEKYLVASIDKTMYYPGFFYVKDPEGKYILCEELSYNDKETYYELSIPELVIDNSLLAKITYLTSRLENANNSLDLFWEIL